MMIKSIIVDDEAYSIEALQLELSMNCPEVEVIKTFQDPLLAIPYLNSNALDLLFLDIQMPAMNGFDVLKALDKVDFEVVFVTAFDNYALQAIKVSAMDYIMKPVVGSELKEAVEKVEKSKALRQTQKQVDFLLTNLEMGAGGINSKIALPTSKGLDFVSISEIHYCQAEGNYTSIHTINGEKYLISRTLGEFESMLNHPQFFRSHKSYLVNLNYIKQYLKGAGGIIVLKDGTQIQVARSRKDQLIELIYN